MAYKTVRAVLLDDLRILVHEIPLEKQSEETLEASNELHDFIMRHTDDREEWRPKWLDPPAMTDR